jgi:cytoskeletal protein CcmA (bactofilin family)
MVPRESAKDSSVPDANRLYIGEGVTIKGDVAVPDTLMVYGTIEGDVTAGTLWVGESGAIKGRVTVNENAEILGSIAEKLDVRCLLVLRSSGRIDAKVSCGMLQIEQGASFTGGITSTDTRPEPQAVKAEPRLRPEQRLTAPGNGVFTPVRTELPALESIAVIPRAQ